MGFGSQPAAQVGAKPNAAGALGVEPRPRVAGSGYAEQVRAVKPGQSGYAVQAAARSPHGGRVPHVGGNAHDGDPRAGVRPRELPVGQCVAGAPQCKGGELVDPETKAELKRRATEKSPQVSMLWDDRLLLVWSDNNSSERDGVILLDNGADWDSLVEDLVHELVHRSNNELFPADAATQKREEYVAAKLEDEVAAEAFTFAWKIQQGHRAGGDTFTAFVKHLEKKGVDFSNTVKLEQEANAFLTRAYQRGALRTSNSGKHYEDYHGEAWDRHHAEKPK